MKKSLAFFLALPGGFVGGIFPGVAVAFYTTLLVTDTMYREAHVFLLFCSICSLFAIFGALASWFASQVILGRDVVTTRREFWIPVWSGLFCGTIVSLYVWICDWGNISVP